MLRAANAPYFVPDADPAATGQQIYRGPDLSYNDPNAATGLSTINHFYVVQALDAAGNVVRTSNHVGEFTFDLTPAE